MKRSSSKKNLSTKLTEDEWMRQYALPHLPMTMEEAKARGWDELDVVFVTGDAYVDHPSFAMAILGRALEAAGFRVGILSQPNWRSCEPWKTFGRPKLFYGVSAGNMDSMVNHYTANRKFRNDDAYTPGGKIGLRPDRATMVYCQRAREAYAGVPVIAGGVEASLRRLAHYDFWSHTVKRSVLLDCKADLVAYGMGENLIVEIAKRMQRGDSLKDLRSLRGVCYALGAKEPLPTKATKGLMPVSAAKRDTGSVVMLPSYEEVKFDKDAFLKATRLIHTHTNPFNAAILIQKHDHRHVVVNPPELPFSQKEMDDIYDRRFNRRPHPSYREKIPAFEMIKDSVTIMRGCFGGCTFCSITAHQGRTIQSRSLDSVKKEVQKLSKDPNFKGVISDIGGPTANMYEMRCTDPEVEAKCRRLSCVHPTVCKLLGTSHKPLIKLLRTVRNQDGVRRAFVASGVRMDLAQESPAYLYEMAKYHVGGHLKVAPEHTDPKVLAVMKKPGIENFEAFASKFEKASKRAGKPKQYLVPYFISSHPGCDMKSMIELALFLKRSGYRPDQVQDFIPAPFDIATCIFYTGRDPFTNRELPVSTGLKDRRMQRALMQFFKPENYFEVRRALESEGRYDLIGDGCDALISANPPGEAIHRRRVRSQKQVDYVHQIPSAGYRPGRSGAQRRERTKAPPK